MAAHLLGVALGGQGQDVVDYSASTSSGMTIYMDGSFGTGGAVLVVCTIAGMNIWLAMLLAFLAGCIAGLVTGILHTKFGIPAILAGILTQLAL